MTDDEFKDVKELWKLTYGINSLQQAADCLEYMLRSEMPRTHPIFDGLLVAVHVLYCRPFMDNAIVRSLKSDFIPEREKVFHKDLMKFRNEMFAHTDAEANKTDIHGPLLQAGFTFKAGTIPSSYTTNLHFQQEHLEIFFRYFRRTQRLMEGMALVILDHNRTIWPQTEGDYILNIYDQSKPMFVTRAEAIQLAPPDAKLLNAADPPAE